jgi:hypothetical protein
MEYYEQIILRASPQQINRVEDAMEKIASRAERPGSPNEAWKALLELLN